MVAASPAQAVYKITGPTLSHLECQRVADAVLAWYETACTVEHRACGEQWERYPDYREHALRDLRRTLMQGLVEKGMLPIELPVEQTSYVTPWHDSTSRREASREWFVANSQPYDVVTTLSVRVRRGHQRVEQPRASVEGMGPWTSP